MNLDETMFVPHDDNLFGLLRQALAALRATGQHQDLVAKIERMLGEGAE